MFHGLKPQNTSATRSWTNTSSNTFLLFWILTIYQFMVFVFMYHLTTHVLDTSTQYVFDLPRMISSCQYLSDSCLFVLNFIIDLSITCLALSLDNQNSEHISSRVISVYQFNQNLICIIFISCGVKASSIIFVKLSCCSLWAIASSGVKSVSSMKSPYVEPHSHHTSLSIEKEDWTHSMAFIVFSVTSTFSNISIGVMYLQCFWKKSSCALFIFTASVVTCVGSLTLYL